ncbi:hypothetical protein, partial [Bifidobacterium pullorum]|uniref:hypothetical protein n=1 Tax=Bifidobacterium pullorum TaxID=78448 RepID=UPI0019561A07
FRTRRGATAAHIATSSNGGRKPDYIRISPANRHLKHSVGDMVRAADARAVVVERNERSLVRTCRECYAAG